MKESFKKRMNRAMDLRGMKQIDLVEKTGLPKSAISQYVSGKFEPKQTALFLIAQALDVSEAWLMGYDVEMDKLPENVYKVETRKIPMIGTIAAGQPIVAEEQIEYYVEAGTHINADFCLKVKGDSMINARIMDGDIVFIKKQDTVDEGQIAAVLIDNEATLKRVYRTNDELMLVAENPTYKPMIYKERDGKDIRILGKAVAFQSYI